MAVRVVRDLRHDRAVGTERVGVAALEVPAEVEDHRVVGGSDDLRRRPAGVEQQARDRLDVGARRGDLERRADVQRGVAGTVGRHEQATLVVGRQLGDRGVAGVGDLRQRAEAVVGVVRGLGVDGARQGATAFVRRRLERRGPVGHARREVRAVRVRRTPVVDEVAGGVVRVARLLKAAARSGRCQALVGIREG